MHKKNLSILLFLTFIIFILLPVAPLLRDWWRELLGEKNYKILWGISGSVFFLFLFYFSFKKPKRFILMGVLIFLFLIKGAPEEKFHLLIYFLIGNFSKKCFNYYGAIYFTGLALLDEIIQYFLPNRYFDLKDIILNIGGGITGFLF